MDTLEKLYENYQKSQNDLAKYFGLNKIPSICDIGEVNDYYWFIDEDNYLNYSDSEGGFETGDYYCLDDGCDEEIRGRWETDEYVALQVGCGEHYNGRFEIFRKDREIKEPEDLD